MPQKPFSLLVKPASADCNLHCTYCFYLDHAELYPETRRHRMSNPVLEAMIASYMATEQPTYSFGWQGGEPTLMGADFFKKVTDYQQKHGRPGAVVANGLQTNATLITDEMAAHLAEYHFLMGVSIDGPPSIHDRYRVTADGRGSHRKVIQGLDHLRRHKVEYNVLVLVSAANVGRPKEVYEYLINLGSLFHQYIPCVEFDSTGKRLPFAIDGGQWGEFLCGIFDEWVKRDTHRVSIRFFDSILTQMVDGHPSVCYMDKDCCQYFVVEYNGDVYPCDFFVEKRLKLGNVTEGSWSDFLESPLYRDFGRRKTQVHPQCRSCAYARYCAGDCPKQRYYGKEDPAQLSFLCQGWMRFYRHALPEFRRLASEIREQRMHSTRQPVPSMAGSKSPGRNDPCYCGSGRKFKHCHGKA